MIIFSDILFEFSWAYFSNVSQEASKVGVIGLEVDALLCIGQSKRQTARAKGGLSSSKTNIGIFPIQRQSACVVCDCFAEAQNYDH